MPRSFPSLLLLLGLVLALSTATSRAFTNTLVVKATPAGATVELAEASQKMPAPATFELKRRDDPYVFTVEKPGYQSESVSYLTRSKLKEITVALEPLQTEKDVSIKTVPDGANVTIDGKPAGTTPLAKPAMFYRDNKSSPWKPIAVVVSKTDYQTESFSLPYDNPTGVVNFSQLRKERVFNVAVKSTDGAPIQATLTLEGKELGAAPQKVAVVFSRPDKTKPWPTFNLSAEIPTIYQPQQLTLTQDLPDAVGFTLKAVTELEVPLMNPSIEMTATGARINVDQTTKIGTLEGGERNAAIASLSRVTRFSRRDQNPKAPLQALNSYAITPDGESAIFSVTSQDEANGKYYSALFIKRVEDDGGGIARLVDNNKRYFDTNPIIAPDTNNILVFQSNRGDLGKPDIFRVNFADNRITGGVSRITSDQRFNYDPSYTDSNQEVVYLSVEPNYPLAKPQLSTVKFDGALPTQFPIVAEEVSHREHTKIYFTRKDQGTGKRQIYSVDPDGRLETNLISDDTFLAHNCFNAVASFTNPVRILFVSDRDVDEPGRNNNNIYVMNADGSQIQQLTNNGSDDILPAWSPTDPNVLYFLSNRGGAYNLWRMRLK